MSKSQLQHLHVVLAGPQHTVAREELASLKKVHEDSLRFKGKV